MLKQKYQRLELKGMSFQALHGVYAEEKKTLKEFKVDIDIWADFSAAMSSDHLQDTVDYTIVYNRIYQIMQTPIDLIEHLAQRIADDLASLSLPIEQLRVYVVKMSPPVGGPIDHTAFELICRNGLNEHFQD